MKCSLALTTIDCLQLVPFLNLFEIEFIKEVGTRIFYPDNVESIFKSENYVSSFLLSKMVGINIKYLADDFLFLYDLVSIDKLIKIAYNDTIIFHL